jgi:MFS family permease
MARHPTVSLMARLLADITPLRVSPPFRRLWVGHGIANLGQQMTAVAVGIQVYGITDSSLAVGLVGLFQLVPLVTLGLYGGALSDMHDRRKVALLTALGMWVCAGAFLLQSLLDLGSVALLYALVAVQSAMYAIGNPARLSIIPRLVKPELLPSANALGMITYNLGFTVGPLLGGLLIGVVESFGGLFLGESLGQVGIFVIFIAVLLLRPQGLFGAKA